MRKAIFLTFVAALLTLGSAEAVVRDLHTLRDLEEIVEPGDWVVFDVDNTLLCGAIHWGNGEWFMHHFKKGIADGGHHVAVANAINRQWLHGHTLCKLEPVEEDTADVVRRLQDRGITVFGLTARTPLIDIPTLDALVAAGIDLEKTAPCDGQIDFAGIPGHVRYIEGLIFCGVARKKGAVFVDIADAFERMGIALPRRVVFVDDSLSQVTDMDEHLPKRGLEVVSLHYRHLEDILKAHPFDANVSHLQGLYLNRILSDSQAAALLGN